MVFSDPDVRAEELPGNMRPKPMQGDLEEAFTFMMRDLEVAPKMPEAIDDGAVIDDLEQKLCETREACERVGKPTGRIEDVPDPDPEPVVEIDEFDVGFRGFEYDR